MKNRNTPFAKLVLYAAQRGIIVERTDREISAWRADNHAVECVSYTIEECYEDIADLVQSHNAPKVDNHDLIGSQVMD